MAETLGTVILEMRANTAPLKAGLMEAERLTSASMNKMQSEMGRKVAGTSAALSTVGSRMTKMLTLPILGTAAASAKLAADFQRSMEMIHTQAGAPQAEITRLHDKVLALAKVTAQSPQALSDGLYHLESIGLRGQRAIDALSASAKGAAISGADLEQTATALGAAWKVGIQGAGDFQHVMGALNAAVGVGNMRMGELVSALGTGVLAAAKGAGLHLQDVLGAFAILSDEGYRASSASAQLATSLHYLTDPTLKAQGAMQKIGLAQGQLSNDLHKPNGLLVALRDIKTHLDDTFPPNPKNQLSIEQQSKAIAKFTDNAKEAGISGSKLKESVDQYKASLKEMGTASAAQEGVMGDIFPAGRGRVLTVLMNQTQNYAQKLGMIYKGQGKAGEDFAATQQTAAFKMKAAWDGLQASAIQFGEKILPKFTEAATKIIGIAEHALDLFNKLPDGMKRMIETGGLVLAGLGPALRIVGAIGNTISRAMNLTTIAGRLLSGQSYKQSMRAAGVGPSAASAAAAKITSEVATMEVGTLIASRVIGAGAGGGAATLIRPRNAKGQYVQYDEGASMQAYQKEMQAQAKKDAAAARRAAASARGGTGSVITRAAAGAAPAEEAAAGGIASRLGGLVIGGLGAGLTAAALAPLAITLVEGLNKAFKGESVGGKIAGQVFSRGFGGPQAQSLQKQLASAIDDFRKDTSRTTTTRVQGGRLAGRSESETIRLDTSQLRGAALQKALSDAGKAGNLVAKTLEKGWNAYKYQSEPVMFKQLRGQLNRFKDDPAIQAAAVKSAVNFSKGLEKSGRLAKGSTQFLLQQVEGEFPGFQKYLGVAGNASLRQFTKAFDLDQLEKKVRGQLHDVGDDFSIVQDAVANTTGDLQKKIGVAVGVLRTLAEGTGKSAKQARADLKLLRQDAVNDFQAISNKAASASKDAAKAVAAGSLSAYQQGSKNWNNLASQVAEAVAAQTISAKKGAEIITDSLNAQLKAFGEKPLSVPVVKSLSAAQLAAVASGQVSSGAAANPHAIGGVIGIGRTGDGGHDNVPLNVGGTPIKVGAGEKVVVFNRHQWPEANMRFADQGGLPGYFAKNTTPNYAPMKAQRFAGGGVVQQMASYLLGHGMSKSGAAGVIGNAYQESTWNPGAIGTGGAGLFGWTPPSKIPGFTGSPSGAWANTLYQMNMLWNGIGGESLSGGYGARLSGETVPGATTDFEANWERPLASAANLPNRIKGAMMAFNFMKGMKGALEGWSGGAGGMSGTGVVNAPKVSGSGTLATVLRGMLKRDAKGATDYLDKHTMSTIAGGLDGGGGNSGVSGAGLPAGVGEYDGKPVDKWIIPILQWARTHGWGGSVASGYRTAAQQLSAATGYGLGHYAGGNPYGSNHMKPNYPGGAVDVSDYAQLASVLKGYPSKPTLVWGGPVMGDQVHFSATGHARGGIIDMIQRLAKGGNVWRVPTSQEESASGNGWTELSTNGNAAAKSGHAHTATHQGGWDFATLGRMYPKYTKMDIRQVSNGRSGTFSLTDFGDGSAFAPAIGLTPAARAALGGVPSGGMVDISLASGADMQVASGFGRLVSGSGGVAKGKDGKPLPSVADQAKKAQLARAKKLAGQKSKVLKQPGMRGLGVFGELSVLDGWDTKISNLQKQQGYLQDLNGGGAELDPLVTLADGNTEVINWGALTGKIPTGMVDPSTHQVTKGIHDRLREITGDPLGTGTSTMNPNTELGIENLIYSAQLGEQAAAHGVHGDLLKYLARGATSVRSETNQISWLTQALDLTQPEPKMGKAKKLFNGYYLAADPSYQKAFGGHFKYYSPGTPYWQEIVQKVKEYRNAQAIIDRWEKLKKALPAERRARDEQITDAYAKRRLKIQKSSATATWSRGDLLSQSISELGIEENKAVNAIPSKKPHDFKGDADAWRTQSARERSDIHVEFQQRADALRRAAGKESLTTRLKRADASTALSTEERADRNQMENFMGTQETVYQDVISGRRTMKTADKSWLTTLKSNIGHTLTADRDNVKDGQDLQSQLDSSYTGQYSDLAIAIKTAKNVVSEPNIPGYLAEIASLMGTTPDADTTGSGSGSDVDERQLDLLQQQLASSRLAYDVLERQTAALSDFLRLPPFGGSFSEGGYVPGPMGAARTIIAHGGELIQNPEQQGNTFHIVVQDGAVNADKIRVIANGEAQKVNRSAARAGGRLLPGGAGGR